MKKIIISLDHVMGAIVAAYEREMKIKSIGCSTEDGRMILRFSVDMIKRSQLDKLEATKWLKKCGFDMKYQGVLNLRIAGLPALCRKLEAAKQNLGDPPAYLLRLPFGPDEIHGDAVDFVSDDLCAILEIGLQALDALSHGICIADARRFIDADVVFAILRARARSTLDSFSAAVACRSAFFTLFGTSLWFAFGIGADVVFADVRVVARLLGRRIFAARIVCEGSGKPRHAVHRVYE